jgi:predicted nucleic acid-binding protein
MVLADTSIWIEFLRGNQPFFDQVSEVLEKNEILALSLIFGELLQGAENNNERKVIIDFWNNLPKLPETDLFIRAGLESNRHKWIHKGIGLIDSAILVAARDTSSFIWTLDKKLLSILRKEEIYKPGK